MSIRSRLTAAFSLVVMLPMAVSAALILTRVPRTLDRQVGDRLRTEQAAVSAVVREMCTSAQFAAELLGQETAARSAQQAVDDLVERDLVRYAVVTGADGKVLASAGTAPQAGPSGARPTPQELGDCASASGRTGAAAPSGALAATVVLRGPKDRPYGQAGVAVPITRDLFDTLTSSSGADVTVVVAGQPVLSTLPDRAARRIAQVSTRAVEQADAVRVGSVLVTAARTFPGGPVVAVSDLRPGRGTLVLIVVVLLLGALGIAVVVAWLLARVTTRPLVELADAAGRVAGGDLDTTIAVRSRDDLGRLATAFNDMTGRLRTHIRALESSRDELRRNLERLGDTLSGTHDLDRILGVVLDTAMVTTRATAGAIFLADHGRGDLYLRVGRGLRETESPARVRLGQGVTGRVAVRGESLRRHCHRDEVVLDPAEPTARALLSVPLRSGGKVVGVLNLYDPDSAEEFREDDLVTIRSFAAQATVAIDNVLLHQEAQRLSITDGLTGLWNYRYFQMSLGREIERAVRFGRPLGLLMLDLDRFKQVNDEHGHQRGDAVLVELATRVKSMIREVDVLARYGGEEFVLLLPETDLAGLTHITERVCDVVRRVPFGGDHPGEEPLPVTVSIGAAVFPQHARTAGELVRVADEALYAAKAGGRDCWRLAAPLAEDGGFTPGAGG